MFLSYLHCRSRETRHGSPARFSGRPARIEAGFLSTVIMRGLTTCGWLSALRKKRLAALVSRRGESRMSMVWPRLSTARYR